MKPNSLGIIPTERDIGLALSEAGVKNLPRDACEKLRAYLELLLHWNRRINLTSDRDPARILDRHLIECAFVAMHLPEPISKLLDFGSGAGLPGIPIAICRPEIQVTLADSIEKKAAFLREAVRTLGIEAEVYCGRVESMPRLRNFDGVALRAVERTAEALPAAEPRARRYLVWMTTRKAYAAISQGGLMKSEVSWSAPIPLPHSHQAVLLLGKKTGIDILDVAPPTFPE